MQRAWYAPLLFSTLLCGCGVVNRAEQCGKLSEMIKKAAPEIEKTTIPDSPPPKSLRKKARLYGQLAENMEKVHFNDEQVKTEQQKLILSLSNLERHLLEAAEAVEAQDKLVERQSRMTARHKEILSQKADYAAKSAQANPGGSPSPSAEERSPPRTPRGIPGLVERQRTIGPPGSIAPSSARFSPHIYSYDRAKRAAESETRAVETASRNLEAVCR